MLMPVIAWFSVEFVQNTHEWVLRTLAIVIVFEKHTSACFFQIAREGMLLAINNIHQNVIQFWEKGNSVPRKGNLVQITVLHFFDTALLLWNCPALNQSKSRNFFMHIIIRWISTIVTGCFCWRNVGRNY